MLLYWAHILFAIFFILFQAWQNVFSRLLACVKILRLVDGSKVKKRCSQSSLAEHGFREEKKKKKKKTGNRANLHARAAAEFLIEWKQIMPPEKSHPINPLNAPISPIYGFFHLRSSNAIERAPLAVNESPRRPELNFWSKIKFRLRRLKLDFNPIGKSINTEISGWRGGGRCLNYLLETFSEYIVRTEKL